MFVGLGCGAAPPGRALAFSCLLHLQEAKKREQQNYINSGAGGKWSGGGSISPGVCLIPVFPCRMSDSRCGHQSGRTGALKLLTCRPGDGWQDGPPLRSEPPTRHHLREKQGEDALC